MNAYDRLVESFRRTFAEGRMGHAYLFFGPPGIGKRDLAIQLTKFLLCSRGGCGHCDTCHRVDAHSHADFRIIQREEGNKEVKIEQIRSLQEEVSLQAMEGPNKVFILDDCHLMSEEAANSLLKTLEEPPRNSFLFLLTEMPDALPETIRSRCQEVRVPLRPAAEIAASLMADLGIPSERAQLLARIAEGSLGKAIQFHESHFLDQCDWVFEKLLGLNSGNELEFAKELDEVTREGTKDLEGRRQNFRAYLRIFQSIWRDLFYLSFGLPEEKLFHRGQVPQQFYTRLSVPPALAIAGIELDLEAETWLQRNANIKLVIENYVLRLTRLLARALTT